MALSVIIPTFRGSKAIESRIKKALSIRTKGQTDIEILDARLIKNGYCFEVVANVSVDDNEFYYKFSEGLEAEFYDYAQEMKEKNYDYYEKYLYSEICYNITLHFREIVCNYLSL